MKKGVSLIALIITIAVIVILAVVVMPKVTDQVSRAKMAQFKTDLGTIKDEYDVYVNSDSDRDLPVEKNGAEYKTYDRNISPDSALDTAVAQNGDSDDTLYILDINKLGMRNVKTGLKQNGQDDIYLVAKDSHNIYYVKGVRDKNGTLYHSLLQANSIGTPRNYTSTTIPATGLINKDQGTIETWVSVGSSLRSGVADKYVFSNYGDERFTNTIALRHTRDNKWNAIISTDYANVSQISVNDNLNVGWHLFSLRWSSAEMGLFIDGAKVGSVANPKLVASVPGNFNVGVGPKLNIIDNGYVTSGDNSNFAPASYNNSDYVSSNASLKVDGELWLEGSKFYPIDASRNYQITGSFKSVGAGGSSKLFYGVAPYDADKNFIDHNMAYHFTNTETELDRDLNPGDTIVYLKNAANWMKSTDYIENRYLCIYNYKDYTPYTYTRNICRFNDSNQVLNTITLSSPYAGAAVLKGTKVANSWENSYWIYSAAVNVNVPNSWSQYSGNITGYSSNQDSSKFRYGAKYVRVGVICSLGQDSSYSLLMDDLELKDLTDTILDTEVDDLCISNTARTDADILARYQANSLFPQDANTTYRMKN